MTRSQFLRRAEWKRFRTAGLASLGFWTVAVLGVLAAGLINTVDLGELPSPVWVDIEGGAATSPTGSVLAGGDVPAPSGPPPTAAPRKEASAELKAREPTPQRSSAAAAAAPTIGAKAATAGSAAAPTAATASQAPADAKAAESWVPGPRPAGSRVIATESGGGAAGGGSASFVTRIAGNEKGNSLETVLGAMQGKSGRSLYVPIYLYMPLPKRVSDSVAGKVPPRRNEAFLAAYQRKEGAWVLARQVPVEERDEVWLALEEGGYDIDAADYKRGGSLSPVSLSFVVTPKTPSSPPRLEAVTLVSGSGDPEVDAAVIYGFTRAAFYNATDGTISGTFTYRFSR